MRRLEGPELGVATASLAAIVALLLLHHLSAPSASNLHDLFRRLIYIPVIVAFIAQIHGDLTTVEGRAETLSFLSDRSGDLAPRTSVAIIRGEVGRARRFLLDLRDLDQRTEGRVGTVKLSALLVGIVADMAADPQVRSGGDLPVRLLAIPEQAAIRGNRATLANSLRALLQGLLSALPPSGQLAVGLSLDDQAVVMTFTADGERSPLPDLRDPLGAAFGPAPSDYKFQQALCLHLLAAEGA
jgi:hypothetical protein